MEDKWFFFWSRNRLFFHRSWTGYCVYVVRFRNDQAGWRTFEALGNPDSEQYLEWREQLRNACNVSR